MRPAPQISVYYTCFFPDAQYALKARFHRRSRKAGLRQVSVKSFTEHISLALPLGELSPQVTERALSFGRGVVCPLRPRCAWPPLPKGEARELIQYTLTIQSIRFYLASNLSVSSMSFSISGHILSLFMMTYYVKKRRPLALPLGELSPQVTERALAFGRGRPLRPRCARPPLPEGEARELVQYTLTIR